MIEVTILYHEENENEKEDARELYDTIYLLITSQFEELEIDKNVVIEFKEFDD